MDEMTGEFNLLLWAAGVACFVSYGMLPQADNLYLGVVLFCVVTVTGVFSYLQNAKSDNMMNEFKSMRPPRVTVVRGGEVSFVDAALITIGDIVKLEQGDLVPADIRVLECSPNMCVDNSSLTGESDPIKRKPECTHSDPLETANLCFFGTQVPEGSCVGVVVKIADDTVIGKIAQLALSTALTRRLRKLQLRVDGVFVVSRHRDAVDVALRGSTRRVSEPRPCRDSFAHRRPSRRQ